MNRQAWIAWSMILLQAVMFWYLAENVLFPLIVVAISLPAVWWRRRWEIASGYLPGIDLCLAAFCTLKWNLAPYEPPNVAGFVAYPLVHAAGQFFLLVQVARLWARRPDRPLPVYLPLLAVLVFICIGDVDVTRRERRMYQHATLTLVGLSCLYFSTARRRQDAPSDKARWVRPTLSVAILVACVLGARAGNAWVLDRWSELEQLMMRAAGQRARSERRNLLVGFSGQAPLGSLQLLRSAASDEIALRIVSDQAPGYLRGAVFERYTPRGWEWQTDWLPLVQARHPLPAGDRPVLSRTSNAPRQPTFLLRPSLATELRPVTIWRAPVVDRFSFLPLATTRLEAATNVLYVDRHTVVPAENLVAGAALTAWVPERTTANLQEPIVQPIEKESGLSFELPRLETVHAKVRLRQVPEKPSPQIEALAVRLFTGCKTQMEKIEAVRRHFATYLYSDKIQIPPRRDPVAYFLLEKPAANCEFFASGTALLLRLASLPCRYVTGYAGAEYNLLGRYWIVRQRDAHAWVEVYLPDTGWMIVDTTPAFAVPPTTESFGMWQVWDDISLRSQMIRTALAQEGWSGKLVAVRLFLLTLVTTIPGSLLTGGTLFLLVRKVRFVHKATRVAPVEPSLIELRRLVQELDRRLRRFDLERAAHETLHHFAERLCAASSSRPNLQFAADWYRHYAAMRYSLAPAPDVQESLRTELRTVCERLNGREVLDSPKSPKT